MKVAGHVNRTVLLYALTDRSSPAYVDTVHCLTEPLHLLLSVTRFTV